MWLLGVLPLFLFLPAGFASLFGSSSDSTSSESASAQTTSTSPGTSSSNSSSGIDTSEVGFLQTLQAAEITSMSCLIALVNMTTQGIGDCLNLAELAGLIAKPASGSSFSSQLDSYLTTTCAQTACSDSVISDAQSQLALGCSGQSNALIWSLTSILDSYSSSYRTLACNVHYNGTSDLCLPSVLNTSSDADSNTFFDALVSSQGLSQYTASVFSQAQCTGCMYEMYKAAVYMIPGIRGNDTTTTMGSHLQNDCTGSSPKWADVTDQQIPDALTVSQSTATASTAAGHKKIARAPISGMLVWQLGALLAGLLFGGIRRSC